MIEGLITGRLTTDPSERTDRFGKTFMVARMRATVGDGNLRPNAGTETPSSLFVNVVAFDPVPCKQLLELQEGDIVSIVGPLTPKVWTDKQGASYPALDVVAYRVLALPAQVHAAEFA
ncbi:single-stranded DNA-binding protein [Comamonas nitrativorans]|uniref:Single-stranded DNA-binding protein n=1 Tax=Comamonas nitrativorans TaxID=108437 RepID=A0ABV9GXT7_9BURK